MLLVIKKPLPSLFAVGCVYDVATGKVEMLKGR